MTTARATPPASVEAAAWLELDSARDVRFPLPRERASVGRNGADLDLDDDTVSRLHAVIEWHSPAWVLHDLASTNGTTVNGRRITSHVLRDGDRLGFGATVVTFRCENDSDERPTVPRDPPPELTPRERDALVALCRPVLTGAMFADPAGLREIADQLVVSESAVKKLLTRAYDKFELEGSDRRRNRLAAEAIRRGAITSIDYR